MGPNIINTDYIISAKLDYNKGDSGYYYPNYVDGC